MTTSTLCVILTDMETTTNGGNEMPATFTFKTKTHLINPNVTAEDLPEGYDIAAHCGNGFGLHEGTLGNEEVTCGNCKKHGGV